MYVIAYAYGKHEQLCRSLLYLIHHHQFIYSTTEQYKYSNNVDTNEVETGMTRLIALTVTPVY